MAEEKTLTTEYTAEVAADKEKTQRTLGTVLCVAIFAIAVGLIVLTGMTVLLADLALTKEVIQFVAAPLSMALGALAGFAASIGVNKDKG